MTRLRTLPPMLKPLGSTIRSPAIVERKRGRAGMEQRDRRLLRTNYMCEMCLAKGKDVKATIVDHIVPLAHGGSDDDSNTRNLCDDCNRQVTAEQFGTAR